MIPYRPPKEPPLPHLGILGHEANMGLYDLAVIVRLELDVPDVNPASDDVDRGPADGISAPLPLAGDRDQRLLRPLTQPEFPPITTIVIIVCRRWRRDRSSQPPLNIAFSGSENPRSIGMSNAPWKRGCLGRWDFLWLVRRASTILRALAPTVAPPRTSDCRTIHRSRR